MGSWGVVGVEFVGDGGKRRRRWRSLKKWRRG